MTPLNNLPGTVEVFLPNFGVVAGIPVVGEAEAGFDVAEALSGADPDTGKAGPYSIGSATFVADGSSDTRKDSASTTVTVSGDVTFASDSAELSGQADAVLASAVEQIKRFPSGGGLAITGHTDDVADDAHNQTDHKTDRRGEYRDLYGNPRTNKQQRE